MVKNSNELDELKKCIKDKTYCIENYFFIQDPVKGKIPFKLFDYQKDLVKKFDEHRFNIIFKPRQMGLSWLIAAHVLLEANFTFDQIIDMISIKEEAAIDLLGKVKYIYSHLPKLEGLESVLNFR